MQASKMNSRFVQILKGNEITYSNERNIKGVCSLTCYHIEDPGHTHPHHWEMHPDGDELLLVANGEIDVEVVAQSRNMENGVPSNPERETVTVRGGESFIVKKGSWHRILLKKETDLVVGGFWGGSKHAPVI